MSPIWRIATRLVFLAAAGWIASCSTGLDGTGVTVPLPKATSTSTPTTNGTSSSSTSSLSGYTNEYFYLTASFPNSSQMLVHADGDFTKKCRILPTDTSKDMVCLWEAEELDLHYTPGMKLVFNAPAAMCGFVHYSAYYYYRWEPGVGPSSTITVTTDSTGNVSMSPVAPAGTNTSISLIGGKPVCNRDYSDPANGAVGPNCCVGNKRIAYVTLDTAGAASAVSFDTSPWGTTASLASCLAGAAVDTQPKSKAGFPTGVLYNTTGGSSLTVTMPELNTPLSKEYNTNLYLANFYVSSDGSYSLAQAPVAMQGPGGGIPSTNPFFQLYCYDHAKEIVARIRLLVRSWTTNSQFTQQAAGNWALSGAEPPVWTAFQLWDYVTWGTTAPNMMTTYPSTAGVEN